MVIGNSSTGVREAPFLGIASINIGTRQKNRSLAESVIDFQKISRKELKDAIDNRWGQRFNPHNGYGSGNSVVAFKKILKSRGFWELPLQKYFDDI